MLGILVGCRTSYEVSFNKEAGSGQYDIILVPKDNNERGIVLELKMCEKEEDLQTSTLQAIQAIKDKRYIETFQGMKEVLCIGLCFCGNKFHGEYEIIQ